MSRLTVLTHVALPEDGVGVVVHAIRALELANALTRRGHDVALLTTAGTPGPGAAKRDEVLRRASQSKVVILQASLAAAACEIKRLSSSCVVVLDLFDAPLIGIIPDLAAGIQGEIEFELHRLNIEKGCLAADLFLCATEEQRLWLLGLLTAWGRINPRTYAGDLVMIVPTGSPHELPAMSGAPLFRGRILPKDATVILWPGGVFNHYRPMPMLDALPQILSVCPSAHIVFVGASNSAFSPDNPVLQRLRLRAEEINQSGTRIWFEPSLPYPERYRMYADADVAVCLFENSLETELSFRTRLVDILWGGVPVVTSRGNSLSRLIEETESGMGLASLSPDAFFGAIAPLLSDGNLRRRMRENARNCAIGRLCWDEVVEPLDRFCKHPVIAGDTDYLSRRFGHSLYSRIDLTIRRILLRVQRKLVKLGLSH